MPLHVDVCQSGLRGVAREEERELCIGAKPGDLDDGCLVVMRGWHENALHTAILGRLDGAQVQLDAVPTPVNIDRALTKLEAAARDRGMAVGIASALPASIDRIVQWAKSAEARGFVLVPISAIAIKPKSS